MKRAFPRILGGILPRGCIGPQKVFCVSHSLIESLCFFWCSTQMFDFASSYTSSIHEMQNVRAFNSYNFLIHTFLEYHVPKRPLMVDSRMVMLPITAKPTHASSYYGCHECIIITTQSMALLVRFLKRAPASQEALPNGVCPKNGFSPETTEDLFGD